MNANNTKLTREEFFVFVDHIPLSDEDKETLKSAAKVTYDFSDFLSKKWNTTPIAVESIMELNNALTFKKYIEEHESELKTEEDVWKITSKITSDYAEKEGFPEHEKVGKAIIDILLILNKLTK